MNGFLVELCHAMDDLPIRLCKTLKEAQRVAKATKPMPTDAIRRVFGVNCSTPFSVDIVQFVDGKPVACHSCKDFSD